MKKLRIVLLPAALILIGAAAAFATNVAKNSGDDLVPGYYRDSMTGACKESPTQCSEEQGAICTWKDSQNITHSLFKISLSGTSCETQLYKPVN